MDKDIARIEDVTMDKDKARIEEIFQKILAGRHTPCQLKAPSSAPSWLDKASCKAGQEFYFTNSTGIIVSNMEALMLGMCIPNFYKPLVISQQSHTKKKAKQRYTDTAVMIYSWYIANSWEEDSITAKMMRKVNAMHRNVAKKVRPLEDIEDNVREVLEKHNVEEGMSEQDQVLLESIADLRKEFKFPQEYYDYCNDSVPFSECDMTLVQGAFFGQVLLYPEFYGTKAVTEQDLLNYIHLWRANGYFLGIKDDNNAVLDTVKETRDLAKLILERILRPCMLNLSKEALYMAKTAAFPGMDYHVTVYTIYELQGFHLERLWKSFSLFQKIIYWSRLTILPHVYPLPGVQQALNFTATKILDFLMNASGPKKKMLGL